MYKIINPTTVNDFEKYYYLRWILLRRPLKGKKGSEKDNYENKSSETISIIKD